MGHEERREERATVDSERGRRRMRGPLGGGEWEGATLPWVTRPQRAKLATWPADRTRSQRPNWDNSPTSAWDESKPPPTESWRREVTEAVTQDTNTSDFHTQEGSPRAGL
ncbi:hypothetical protein EYF80_042985 [Liparis tanakae]|uniref:Uncharacterized protein n=1 Tax=Liparis tanakae TaxID=230148 RepID=A0A4Z2G141_9TELE|nr:hypothetical protein EYF80_042985 [Liparis tanakae]